MARDLTGILDAVLAGIVVLDTAGRVELLNAAASRILGLSSESARGRAVEQLLGADHALALLARRVLASGRSGAEGECRVERRFEPDLIVDVAASALHDEAGRHEGAVVFLRDSTLQRDLRRAVSERETLGTFGRIAAGVAHEVKNPLGGIRGAAEILAARAEDAKTTDAAELVVREVDRITALLDDLMIFTQSAPLRLAPTNIHRLLDDGLALLAMDPIGRGVAVERRFDPSIPDVLVDRDRITQVFLNLARNALQAMGGRGMLTIHTGLRLDRRLTTEDGQQHPTLRIDVEDDGPGVEPDVLEKLFTPFFTTRAAGTGLGLALSRYWVVRHEGTLRMESEGAGCLARVELPARTAT